MYEFKVGDNILIDSKEDYKNLMKILDKHGYRWSSGDSIGEFNPVSKCNKYIIIKIRDDKKIGIKTANDMKFFANENYIKYSDIRNDIYNDDNNDYNTEEFKSELTAAEALKGYILMCDKLDCLDCPFEQYNNGTKSQCHEFIRNHPNESIKIIDIWIKENHSIMSPDDKNDDVLFNIYDSTYYRFLRMVRNWMSDKLYYEVTREIDKIIEQNKENI